ncbi:MAG: sugar transferase [Clostridia bacterium]|nr:sugar transferase [Clostridia bacterium]
MKTGKKDPALLEAEVESALREGRPVDLEKIVDGLDPVHVYSDGLYEAALASVPQGVPAPSRAFRFWKRAFDLFASALALAFLFLPMLAIALAVKIDDPGGRILFVQNRMGLHGKSFRCLKFRTMKSDAPHDLSTAELSDPRKYLTRVGPFLRRFSLDELPQLWNVLKGDMSLIGPRPLVTREACNQMRLSLGVYAVRPGVSGLAQVRGRDDVYYKNKALMDAVYVKRASLFLDLDLMWQTVRCVLLREGNAAEKY